RRRRDARAGRRRGRAHDGAARGVPARVGIRLHRTTISRLRLRRGIEAPRRRRRIRKLRLLALLVALGLLASVAFTLGLVRAVAGEIPSLDPARQRGDVDSVIYAADGRSVLAVLRGS